MVNRTMLSAQSLDALLSELEFEGEWLATALNGEFVRSPERRACRLNEGDRVEDSYSAARRMTMLKLYNTELSSRVLLGTAQYPSPAILMDAIKASGTEIVTVSLRREMAGGKSGDKFWSLIRSLGSTCTAEYGWMPYGQGGCPHGADGKGCFYDRLDQARGHWQS